MLLKHHICRVNIYAYTFDALEVEQKSSSFGLLYTAMPFFVVFYFRHSIGSFWPEPRTFFIADPVFTNFYHCRHSNPVPADRVLHLHKTLHCRRLQLRRSRLPRRRFLYHPIQNESTAYYTLFLAPLLLVILVFFGLVVRVIKNSKSSGTTAEREKQLVSYVRVSSALYIVHHVTSP